MELVYPVAKAVWYLPMRYGLQFEIEGGEHILERGSVLLASNHISYLDPVTLAWAADRQGRRVRYLAKTELFDAWYGGLFRAGHQIPVARGNAKEVAGSLERAAVALRAGECVGVFPEGTIPEELGGVTVKSGTARLARAAGVPVTPVGQWGVHAISTRGRTFRPRLGVTHRVVIGEPVFVAPDEHVKAASKRIRDAIQECVDRARRVARRDEP